MLSLFRELSAQERKEFKEWARENYTPYSPINGTWHWVIQMECVKMNREYNLEKDLGIMEGQLPLLEEE